MYINSHLLLLLVIKSVIMSVLLFCLIPTIAIVSVFTALIYDICVMCTCKKPSIGNLINLT